MSMFGFSGRYQFIKHKADTDGNVIPGTDEIVLPWFDNLITNAGLDFLGSSTSDNLLFCQIGTGNTDPALTDTALATRVSGTSDAGLGGASGVSGDNTYLYRRVSRRFPAGTIHGVNLAEVGMAQTTSGTLFSRSLLKDALGATTTITLESDEVLDVVYELRCYLTVGDTTVTQDVDGVSTTVTIRLHGVITGTQWTNFASVLGVGFWATFAASNRNTAYLLENQPSQATVPGYVANGSTNIVSPSRSYTNGTHSLVETINAGLTVANFGTGVGALVFSTADIGSASLNGAWSWGFSPKLNKTSIRTAQVIVGLTWGRYTP